MENDYLQEEITYEFFSYPETKEFFAKVDYYLKNNVHIQRQTKPTGIFQYLRKAYPSLKRYYNDWFELPLTYDGQGDFQYFFIDFEKDIHGKYIRGNIPPANRRYLKDAYLLIAFLMLNIYDLDGLAEDRHTLSGFLRIIREQYENYQTNLVRLLAKNDSEFVTDVDYNTITGIVRAALDEFDALGWISFDSDTDEFELLPSSHRLFLLYDKQIRNIEEIIRNYHG